MSENRHHRRTIAHERRVVGARVRAQRSPVLFVLLAFLALFQASIVQTHIHVYGSEMHPAVAMAVAPSGAATADHAAGIANPAAPRDTYPPGGDPANCPLCQEVAHLSQFVHSTAILVAQIESVTVSFFRPESCRPVCAAAAHFWHGRAPPSL